MWWCQKRLFHPCQEIRIDHAKIPIIFLTAKTLKDDVLEGFKIGADDYISKTIYNGWTLFRIEAIMRRVNDSSER